MRLPSTLLAVAIALVGCGKSSPPPSPHGPGRQVAGPSLPAVPARRPGRVAMIDPVMTPKVAALMRRVQAEDELCRDIPQNAKALRACNTRTRILDRLDKMGWCEGPEARPTAEQDWMKCKDDPGYQPGIYEKPYYTEKDIRELSVP
jgi:hypothetical protein